MVSAFWCLKQQNSISSRVTTDEVRDINSCFLHPFCNIVSPEQHTISLEQINQINTRIQLHNGGCRSDSCDVFSQLNEVTLQLIPLPDWLVSVFRCALLPSNRPRES
jgi:hypothetical protein